MITFALHGIGVSGGIAIGRAQLVSHATLEVAHYTVPASRVDQEIARLDFAVDEVQKELTALHGTMMREGELPGEFGAFLDVHWMILNDPTLAEAPKRIIAEQRCNAEWALVQQMNVLIDQFEQIEDPYLRERKNDVVQVVERVLKRLMGKPGSLPTSVAEERTILVAHDLSPADVIQFKTHHFAAFLTDLGGVTSHTAIVARSLSVPAVVATHNARQMIRDGEMLIVDGSNDVVQVVERVLKRLMGKPGALPTSVAEERTILVAHDLSPADVIQFKSHHFAAFLTDLGGVTSHTAIVARSLSVPAVVATHNARQMIRDGEMLIVDGSNHVVIVNPDRAVLAEYRLKQSEFELERQKLKRLRGKPAETLDHHRVMLNANIELPGDLDQVLDSGANGVGLFRSEFLFLNRVGLPSEDEQFEAYRAVAAGLAGKPVTVRTFDLGADKTKEDLDGLARVAPNPALGLRAVRFCLSEPKLFMTQLRAILRATHYGKIRILIPMLASVAEIDQTLAMIDRAKESLREQGEPFDENVPVGGMIEIPAAVLAMGGFLERLDFLSIGTNDLIQYTLAVDRSDEAVSHLYDPLHPAIIKLLALAIGAANKAKVPIAVCGEMAGEVGMTRLLLGLGLRDFSMHPAHVPTVKQRVLNSDVSAAKPLVDRIKRTDSPEKLAALIDKLNA